MRNDRSMISASAATASWADLMQLYTKNFYLLRQLFDAHARSKPQNLKSVLLHAAASRHYVYRLTISTTRADRWTSVSTLVYALVTPGNQRKVTVLLRLRLRVYHDSKQAEITSGTAAISCCCNRTSARWYANYFLFSVLLLLCRTVSRRKTRHDTVLG